MTDKAVRAIISGRVQGVNYRNWTKQEAEARGLNGWVLNREDGRVEALFAGPAEGINEMLTACRDGPRAASVDDIETEDAEVPDGRGFEIRR